MNTVCGHWVNFDIISVQVEINHLIGGYKAIFKGPLQFLKRTEYFRLELKK